jgi:hypothetical protein
MLTKELYNGIFSELLQEAVQRSSINDAIDNRYVCKIRYNDGTGNAAIGERIVEIFAYGRTKKGHDAIRVWQRSGASRTPNGKRGDTTGLSKISGWRLLRVDRISELTFLKNEEPFSPDREQYNPDENGTLNHMATTYRSVDPEAPAVQRATKLIKPQSPANPIKQNGEIDTRVNNQANRNEPPKPTTPLTSLGSSIKSGVKSGVNTLKSKMGGLLDKMKGNNGDNNKPKRNIYEGMDISEGIEFIDRVLQG